MAGFGFDLTNVMRAKYDENGLLAAWTPLVCPVHSEVGKFLVRVLPDRCLTAFVYSCLESCPGWKIKGHEIEPAMIGTPILPS